MDIAHIPEMLPLKSDFVFKRVFGDENNVDVLTAFLKSKRLCYRFALKINTPAQVDNRRRAM